MRSRMQSIAERSEAVMKEPKFKPGDTAVVIFPESQLDGKQVRVVGTTSYTNDKGDPSYVVRSIEQELPGMSLSAVLDAEFLLSVDAPRPRTFKSVVLDRLVTLHIYQHHHEDDPVRALDDLIKWEVEIALDPKVSGMAQELVESNSRALRNQLRNIKSQLETIERVNQELVAKMLVSSGV